MATAKKAAKAAKGSTTTNLPTAPGHSTSIALAVATPLPEGITRKRVVTVPALAMKKAGEVRYLLILDPMVKSTIEQRDDQGRVKEPPMICTVGDVMTGEMLKFIVPKMVVSTLEREYPDADAETGKPGYVGKTFRFCNVGKKQGKAYTYHEFSVEEVEVDTAKVRAALASQPAGTGGDGE